MSRVRQRIIEPEILDLAGDEEAARNLKDIARINWWTGARRELVQQLRAFRSREFQFLDVGAASGDMGLAVKMTMPGAKVVSLDIMHRNLKAALQPKVQADAFRLPFGDRSFEVVHCSLFLHHFTNEEVGKLIAEMYRVSKDLVLIQDLHRHFLSYYFLPLTKWIFRWNDITVSDGMKSVSAGWKRSEITEILQKLNLNQKAKITWHFPSFRYFIAIRSTG